VTLSKSECAKLGSQKSREVSAEIKRENIERYLKTPKLCKKCSSIIPYKKRRNDYCTMSCAASIRNKGVRRHGNPELIKVKRDLYLKSNKCKIMKKIAQNKRYKSKRKTLLLTFGESCILCNFEKRITIHKKDGTDHKDFHNMSWDEINDIITNHKNDYVSVCYKCHNHTHWCMRMLGMTWDDIYKLFSNNAMFIKYN
jgi:hypothetical protein